MDSLLFATAIATATASVCGLAAYIARLLFCVFLVHKTGARSACHTQRTPSLHTVADRSQRLPRRTRVSRRQPLGTAA